MKKYKQIIIIVNLIGLLGIFGYSLFEKESIISNKTLILLELAPVDPRSLMQGDYMNLRYHITSQFNTDNTSKKGVLVVNLNHNNVGINPRIQPSSVPLNKGDYLIKYAINSLGIHIGAESFFFQEGKADLYEEAKYGGIKVDDNGNSVLIGLYNNKFEKIE